MKKGIDIAKWNKITNYQALKPAGVEFAILKVINGGRHNERRIYNKGNDADDVCNKRRAMQRTKN
ncbi:hypothetical protein C809_04729, partial [Lachnospiraceae bacterium MD335]